MLKIQTGKNNPILRKKSLKIKEVDDNIRNLAEDMLEIMNKNNGVGLSACQIGKNIRMFVLPKELSSTHWSLLPQVKRDNGKWAFINPEIIKLSKKTNVMKEGCLSLPGIFIPIERAKSLRIKAIDENGKVFKLKAKGLLSRVIQHETDHLDGVLIIDKHI